MANELIRVRDAARRLGVSYATLWNWIKAGEFPPGRALSPAKRGRICWVAAEVQEWIASRPVRMPKGSKAA